MKVIRWNGEPISEPGIYAGVPMKAYHGQLTVTPSISSGGLRKIENESCAHYFAESYLNPDRVERADSEALIFGRATHHLFGGEDRFFEHFALQPATYPDSKTGEDKPWHGGAKFCKQWAQVQRENDRTVVTEAQLQHIRGMAASLDRHPAIEAGLLKGEVERSIVWRDAKTGVWLKARPDVIPLDCDMIVDLKTCAAADHHSVCRAITEHGYHMQLALAYEGLLAVTGRRLTDFILVFVEKTPPYAVSVKAVDTIDIEYGRRQLRRAIDKFARCLELNEWPAYEDEDIPATLQPHYRKRLADEAEQQLLPAVDEADEPQMEPAE